MQIHTVSVPSAATPGLATPAPRNPDSRSFQSVYDELVAIEKRISGPRALSPQELLAYQIKASRFGLTIEMVSKVAEGISSTIHKLQSNQ